ncbi:MAG: tetratricopeptide repeat protein [Candidatus Levybacteria bacterium]|nr:tetratricopeptide repeat protein [Candidatus Levybacteria bacterium]
MHKSAQKLKYITLKLKFPRIYRFITEAPVIKHLKKFQKRLIVAGFLTALFIGGIVYVSLDLYRNLRNKTELERERESIVNQIKNWQSITEEYKGYRDAYFQLAILEYRLKNFDKSREYLQKTLSLDPNFKEGRELELILNKQ